MDSTTWELIVRASALLLSLIGGVGIVPIIGYVKNALNANGRWAQLITAVAATLLATLTMIMQGQIAPETLTLESGAQLLLAVLIASQAEYRRIKDGKAE